MRSCLHRAANAVFQALYAVRSFVQALNVIAPRLESAKRKLDMVSAVTTRAASKRAANGTPPRSRPNEARGPGEVLCHIHEMFSAMEAKSGGRVQESADSAIAELRSSHSWLVAGIQQDAHEFLRFLLDALKVETGARHYADPTEVFNGSMVSHVCSLPRGVRDASS